MWKTIQCIWVCLVAITSPNYTINCSVLLILLQLALLFVTLNWAELRYCYCQLKEIKDLKSIVGNHGTVCRDGCFHPAVFVAFWWYVPAHHSCWHILHSLTPAVFSSFCFPFPFVLWCSTWSTSSTACTWNMKSVHFLCFQNATIVSAMYLSLWTIFWWVLDY